jgi:penicillin-binding protein 1C
VPGVFGADLAAPVLFQAFARLKPALEPQPPAPPETLLVANAQLAAALAAVPPASAAFEVARDAPAVAFPPDGAEVERLPEG